MSATVAQQRDAIKSVYSGREFGKKVDRMLPDQVHAMYLRLKSQGKIKN